MGELPFFLMSEKCQRLLYKTNDRVLINMHNKISITLDIKSLFLFIYQKNDCKSPVCFLIVTVFWLQMVDSPNKGSVTARQKIFRCFEILKNRIAPYMHCSFLCVLEYPWALSLGMLDV